MFYVSLSPKIVFNMIYYYWSCIAKPFKALQSHSTFRCACSHTVNGCNYQNCSWTCRTNETFPIPHKEFDRCVRSKNVFSAFLVMATVNACIFSIRKKQQTTRLRACAMPFWCVNYASAFLRHHDANVVIPSNKTTSWRTQMYAVCVNCWWKTTFLPHINYAEPNFESSK